MLVEELPQGFSLSCTVWLISKDGFCFIMKSHLFLLIFISFVFNPTTISKQRKSAKWHEIWLIKYIITFNICLLLSIQAWDTYHSVICPKMNPAAKALYDLCDNGGFGYTKDGQWEEIWGAHYRLSLNVEKICSWILSKKHISSLTSLKMFFHWCLGDMNNSYFHRKGVF